MKKKVIAILSVIVLVALLIPGIRMYQQFKINREHQQWVDQGPIPNHPVRIYDVKFAREFNDMNDTQLKVAQAIGVPPVQDREAAEHLKNRLVLLEETDTYVIDSLTHSIPYLIPSAKELLDRIGQNFQDSLAAKGLNPNKLVVTSVLRTEADVKKLRRRNLNASEQSTHRFGTTFDLSYWRYVKVEELRGRPYEDVPPEYLRAVLGQVLRDLHNEPGVCYIKYERKQNCFHITTRR